MTKTVIGLFRHGQTDWNIDFLLQGVTDIPLNQTGIEQVELASGLIRRSDWDDLITSPLGRAVETANILSVGAGLPEAKIEHLLLERSFGAAEGMSHKEWREKYADLGLEPEGGETLAQLDVRSQLLLETLGEKHAGKRVLAVSHGALIRTLIRKVSAGELPRDGERFGNASLSLLEHSHGVWKIKNYDPKTLTPVG